MLFGAVSNESTIRDLVLQYRCSLAIHVLQFSSVMVLTPHLITGPYPKTQS